MSQHYQTRYSTNNTDYMTTSIELQQLTIGYGSHKSETVIARGLNAQLNTCELTCLLGPNGAGKSTLLRTLAAFQPKLGGKVMVMNREIKEYKPQELARLVSIVLTDNSDIKNMTAYDVVAMGRSPYTGFWGKLTERDHAMIDKCLGWVGIETLAKRKMQTLSDGERQKVMIAKAIAQETPIILLDEPTAFLDYPSKVSMMLLLHRLAKTLKKTIFMSTHDLEHALQIADQVWLLDKEHGLTTGSPEDLSMAGSIETYFNREDVTFDRETCNFSIEYKTAREVIVEGNHDDISYRLLCKALMRNGIKPCEKLSEAVTESTSAVRLTVPGDGTYRLLEHGKETYKVERIEHVLRVVVPTIIKNQISAIREAADMTQYE